MVMLELMLLVAFLGGSADGQTSKSPQSCRGVEATLRVMPTTFRRGTEPSFAVVLKNASEKPVRLLDVREGRRPDLADSYYEIIFEQNGRTLSDLPRVISDPGPVEAVDFFVLSPGAIIETALSTMANLSTIPAGRYSAYVRITVDPFAARVPTCRSARTSFTVNK
jgi:hypothetical protein